MPTFRRRFMILMLLAWTLAACNMPARQTAAITPAPPTREPSPTDEAPSSTVQPTFAPTPTPTWAAPTPSGCVPPSDPMPLPQPADLRWETLPASSGTLRRLSGQMPRIHQVTPSPDSRWWAAELAQEGAGELSHAMYVGLLIVDSAGDGHWLATPHTLDSLSYHTFDWLPDNRLLWIDQEDLFIAQGDGSGRTNLNAPEAVYEVWAGANNVAVVSGETAVWRLEVASGVWEQVGGMEGVVKSGSPITDSSSNFALSADRTYGLLVVHGDLWTIPAAMGQPAQKLAHMDHPGRGGRASPPIHLANSPYWYPGTVMNPPGNLSQDIPALLDARNGTLVPVEELVPPPPSGTARSLALAPPDALWLAVAFSAGDRFDAANVTAVYLAPSNDLMAGRFVGLGGFLTAQPDMAYLLEPSASRPGDTFTVTRIPRGGEPVILLSGLADHPQAVSTGGFVFLEESSRIHIFDVSGAELAVLENLPWGALIALPGRPRSVLILSGAYDGAPGQVCTSVRGDFLVWDVP